MIPAKLNELLYVLCVVIVQIAVKPVSSNLSYENKNFIKTKQDPTRYQLASAYRSKKNIFATRYLNVTTPREKIKINAFITTRHSQLEAGKNFSQDKDKIGHNKHKTTPPPHNYKKWQVGRVSRKQYEIINMLWRKTKIFVDFRTTTALNYNFRRSNETERMIDSLAGFHQPFLRLPSRPNLPSTTPSYIEFYYLDEADERVKELTTPKHIQVPQHIKEQHFRSLGNHKFVLSDSPMISFRIDNPNYRSSTISTRYTQPTNRMKRRKTNTHDSSLTGFDSHKSITPTYKFKSERLPQNKLASTTTAKNPSSRNVTLNVTSTISTSENTFDNKTCPYTTGAFTIPNKTTKSENKTSDTVYVTHIPESTTAYDKIKFFETYDKHTPVPYYDENGRLIDMDNVDIFIRGNELNNIKHNVLMENVNHGIKNELNKPYKSKHAKKHIIDTYKSDSKDETYNNSDSKDQSYNNSDSKDQSYNNSDSKDQSNNTSVLVTKIKPTMLNVSTISNITKKTTMKLLLTESKLAHFREYRKSKVADWSRYSFAAAYVYEPSQVHCDAAGISPHWLITSGSCLSRHHKNPGGEGRSAFVTYCGESWWNPERVAYVKYSLVHPRFHPKDKTRRHLYNIGLVQVVTSMASACTGWSSISLMSHQFVTDNEGSIANAIGWGLDRFDTRYSSNDLPKSPLMSYENEVFSDSCPGNVGYSKARDLDDEGGIKNVYCLALPPYLGENNDPIHGGLLLVGGKLVALYLQEERRPWGDQCAQYTGTWRLVPWVLNVARENDELDAFPLEI